MNWLRPVPQMFETSFDGNLAAVESGWTLTPKSASTISFGKAEHPARISNTKQIFQSRDFSLPQFSILLEKGQRFCRIANGAKMDVTTQFKSAVLEFDMTQSLVGRYVGLEPSRVSRALTEELPFTPAEGHNIIETINAMRSVQAEIPLPINWAMIGKVKPLVDQRRKDLRNTVDPIIPRCWYVRLTSLHWLSRLRKNEPVPTINFGIDGAAFTDVALVQEVVRQLKLLGVQSRAELLTAERRSSTITRSLIEIGFETAAIGGEHESTETAA